MNALLDPFNREVEFSVAATWFCIVRKIQVDAFLESFLPLRCLEMFFLIYR